MTPEDEEFEALEKRLQAKKPVEAENQEPLCTAAMFDKWFLAKSGLDPKTPLYTHPQPKREWVGLTNDEIYLCTNHIDRNKRGWANDFARALEAKLKDKNT